MVKHGATLEESVKIKKALYVIYFLQNSKTNIKKCITKRYENAASLWEGLNLCAYVHMGTTMLRSTAAAILLSCYWMLAVIPRASLITYPYRQNIPRDVSYTRTPLKGFGQVV